MRIIPSQPSSDLSFRASCFLANWEQIHCILRMILGRWTIRASRSGKIISTATTFQNGSINRSRWLATSAQKRKWKKQEQKTGKRTRSKRQEQGELLLQEEERRVSKADEIREKGVNWKPIFFLGIFPIAMSGLVILLREDLREEVKAKGLGRALSDFRQWRTQRAIAYELRKERQEQDSEKQKSSS